MATAEPVMPAGDRDADRPKTRVRRVLVRRKVQTEGQSERSRSRSPGATGRSAVPASTMKGKDGSYLPFMVLGDVKEFETQVSALFGSRSHATDPPPHPADFPPAPAPIIMEARVFFPRAPPPRAAKAAPPVGRAPSAEGGPVVVPLRPARGEPCAGRGLGEARRRPSGSMRRGPLRDTSPPALPPLPRR